MSELDFNPFFDELNRRKLIAHLERVMPSFVDWRGIEDDLNALQALTDAMKLQVSRALDETVSQASALYGGWEKYEDALASLSLEQLEQEIKYRNALTEQALVGLTSARVRGQLDRR